MTDNEVLEELYHRYIIGAVGFDEWFRLTYLIGYYIPAYISTLTRRG